MRQRVVRVPLATQNPLFLILYPQKKSSKVKWTSTGFFSAPVFVTRTWRSHLLFYFILFSFQLDEMNYPRHFGYCLSLFLFCIQKKNRKIGKSFLFLRRRRRPVEIKSGANTGKHFSPDSFRLSNVFLFFYIQAWIFQKSFFFFLSWWFDKRRGDDRVMSTHSERARARAKFKILKKDKNKKSGWWWWLGWWRQCLVMSLARVSLSLFSSSMPNISSFGCLLLMIIVIEGVSKAESSFLCVSTGDIVRATVGCCYDICLECVECI